MDEEKISIMVPKTNNKIVNEFAKSYLELKKHEFNSIIKKINNDNYSFQNTFEENSYLNYKDLHITLYYSYGYDLIREDKFFHTLDNSLIDINHFMKETDDLKDYLKSVLKTKLKKYKIKESMTDLVLCINLDNFLVKEDGLEFIYSLSQFGINSKDEIRIMARLKDYYYE